MSFKTCKEGWLRKIVHVKAVKALASIKALQKRYYFLLGQGVLLYFKSYEDADEFKDQSYSFHAAVDAYCKGAISLTDASIEENDQISFSLRHSDGKITLAGDNSHESGDWADAINNEIRSSVGRRATLLDGCEARLHRREIHSEAEDLINEQTAHVGSVKKIKAKEDIDDARKVQLLDLAKKGAFFYKYSRRGKTQRRYVMCSRDLLLIIWGKTKSQCQDPKLKGVSFAQSCTLQEVILGRKTENFLNTVNASDIDHLLWRIPLSFSLVFPDRTLDLELATSDDPNRPPDDQNAARLRRDDFVDAFEILRRRMTEIGTPFNVKHVGHVDRHLNWNENLEENFDLVQKLGEGSFATVWRGVHKLSHFEVAVKLIHVKHRPEREIRAIKNEIQLLKECRHHNIVSYYGCWGPDSQGRLWILMDWCKCGSLVDLLVSTQYSLSELQIAFVLASVLRGLDYIHAKNIMHLDIKCANLMIDEHGIVKLADFGIAKPAAADEKEEKPEKKKKKKKKERHNDDDDDLDQDMPQDEFQPTIPQVTMFGQPMYEKNTEGGQPSWRRPYGKSGQNDGIRSKKAPQRMQTSPRPRMSGRPNSPGKSGRPHEFSGGRMSSPRISRGRDDDGPPEKKNPRSALKQNFEKLRSDTKKDKFNRHTDVYGYKILVTVVRALDLSKPDNDRLNKVDSYCQIKVMSVVKTTKVCKGTTSPEWYEEFEFLIPGTVGQPPAVTFTVWEHDRVKKDEFLGRAVVDLGSYFERNRSYEEYLPLQRVPRGDLQVRIESKTLQRSSGGYAPPPARKKKDGHKTALATTVAGSPLWMAPEVMKGRKPRILADIWSLGVLSIEIAEGKTPYGHLSIPEVLYNVCKKPPPQLQIRNWSLEFHDFVTQCLIYDVDCRPSASDLLRHPFLKNEKVGMCEALSDTPQNVLTPLLNKFFGRNQKYIAPPELTAAASGHEEERSSGAAEFKAHPLPKKKKD